MSKGFRFWVDTETTGLDHFHDQILELAGVVDDADGNEVDRFEFRIKLKHGVTPGPKAIVINQINPYSKEWVQNSLTEHEAAKRFAALAKKYTTKDGLKPFFTAYNADFDKDKCAVMLSCSGIKFSSLFNKSVFDPAKTAKQLTGSGKLVTVLNQYNKYSYSLEEVAKALGEKYEGQAHRALTDVLVMKKVARKLFKMATGHEMHGLSASPKEYKVGSVVKIVTDSKSSGAKIRHVYILENNQDKEHIIGIDEDDIKINHGFSDTAVRQFNYGTIIGEMNPNEDAAQSLISIAKQNKDEAIRLSKKKLKSESDSSEVDEDVRNFEMIEQIQLHMSHAKDKKSAYEFLFDELVTKFNGDKEVAKEVLSRAESLAGAKGEVSWSKSIFPQEGIRVLECLVPENKIELRVALHPRGHYAIGLSYDKNGRPAKELKDCKSKKDVLTFIGSKVGKVPTVVEFVENLPLPGSFSDPKHPAVIEGELSSALDIIAVKGATDNVKAGVAELLMQLQKRSPKIFSKYKLPIDPSGFNSENYWVSKKEDTSGINIVAGFDSVKEVKPINPYETDHVKPGEKLASTPCALCGRALSAEISIQHSMGPTCRRNLHVAEVSDGPLEQFRDTYRPLTTASTPRPGDLVAIRYRDTSGRENEVLAEFITVTSQQTQIIDRRKIKKLLDAGINPNFATYLSMTKLPHGSISGVAKLKPTSQTGEPEE